MRTVPKIVVLAVVLAVALGSCTRGGDEAGDAPETTPVETSAPGSGTPSPGTELPADIGADSGYEWRQIPIGAGGWVTGLVIHPNDPDVRFARTDVGGLYRSEDGQWHQTLNQNVIDVGSTAGDGIDPGWYSVESVAVAPSDPERVYALVGDADALPAEGESPTGTVLSSQDGGRSWSASQQRVLVAGNRESRQRSERLAVDPDNPDHVLVGTRRSGLMRSTDGGTTFEPVSGLDAPAEFEPAYETPGFTFVTFATPSEVYVGAAGWGMFRSDDGGATWRTVVQADEGVVPYEGSVTGEQVLLALDRPGTEEGGRLVVYNRSDDALTDITPNDSSPTWSGAIDPSDAQRIVAADRAVRNGSIFRSVDGGASWTSAEVTIESSDVPWLANTDLDQWMSIGRLVFDPGNSDRLWFAEGMGVWSSDTLFADLAAPIAWTSHSAGIEETVAADMVVTDGHRLSAVADRQGFEHVDLQAYPERTLIDETFVGGTDIDTAGQIPGAAAWIGAEYHRYWDPDRGGRGAVTLDGGQTWSDIPNLTNDHFGGNIAMSATDPNNLVWVPSYFINPWEYDGQPRGVFATTDGGQTWTEHKPLDGSARFHRLVWWLGRRALASDEVEGGVFYLNDDEARFLVSTDGGMNWTPAPHSPPCLEITACGVHGQLRAHPGRAGQVWASVGDGGLFRSDDRGQTEWQQLPGVTDARQFDFGAPPSSGEPWVIYLLGKVDGDATLGLYRSDDDGTSWERIAQHPGGIFRSITVVTADPEVHGRVYVGFNGLGFIRGDREPAS